MERSKTAMTTPTQGLIGGKGAWMQQEAKDHIALGELLKKRRSTPARRAVESVLAESLTVRQKLERIRQIDEEERSKARGPVAGSEGDDSGDGARSARHARTSYRRPVKVLLTSEGYLSFVLRHFRRIVESGYASGMIEGYYLPPRVKLSREAGRAFRQSVVPLAEQVLAICEQALRNGWLHVTKLEYNLIVVCADLCEQVLSKQHRSLDARDRDFLGRIRVLENTYLVLHHRADYVGLLARALTVILQHEGHAPDRVEQVPVLVHRLLSDVCRPSLQGLILSANMVRFRRCLALQDLVRRDGAEPVDARDFDATEEVRRSIERYVRGAEDRLAVLGRRLAEFARVRSFLPPTFDEDGGRAALETFCALGDERNVVVLVVRLLRTYLTVFGGLLCGRAAIEGLGTVQVFDAGLFAAHVLRLKDQLERAVKVSYAFPSLPRDRLLLVRSKPAVAARGEGDFLAIVSAMADAVYDTSESLARILAGGAGAAPQSSATEISFGQRILGDPAQLRGRTVEDALSYAVSIGYLILLHLDDRRVGDFVRGEAKVRDEVSGLLSALERIADPVTYAGIRARYPS